MEKLNEIIELGNAQELILGAKQEGGEDGAVGPDRRGEPDAEEDE